MKNQQDIWMLLQIVKEVAGHPQLVNIQREAIAALAKHDAELSPKPEAKKLEAAPERQPYTPPPSQPTEPVERRSFDG